MKNFDEFSKGIRLNESEIRFLNEEEFKLADAIDDIKMHLEDNKIKAFDIEEKPDGSFIIHIEGDDYLIKKHGNQISQTWKHGSEIFKDEGEMFTWWSMFVPQYKAGEAEYNRGDKMGESKVTNETKVNENSGVYGNNVRFINNKDGQFLNAKDIAEYLLGPDKEENIEIFKGWLAQITNAGA